MPGPLPYHTIPNTTQPYPTNHALCVRSEMQYIAQDVVLTYRTQQVYIYWRCYLRPRAIAQRYVWNSSDPIYGFYKSDLPQHVFCRQMYFLKSNLRHSRLWNIRAINNLETSRVGGNSSKSTSRQKYAVFWEFTGKHRRKFSTICSQKGVAFKTKDVTNYRGVYQ